MASSLQQQHRHADHPHGPAQHEREQQHRVNPALFSPSRTSDDEDDVFLPAQPSSHASRTSVRAICTTTTSLKLASCIVLTEPVCSEGAVARGHASVNTHSTATRSTPQVTAASSDAALGFCRVASNDSAINVSGVDGSHADISTIHSNTPASSYAQGEQPQKPWAIMLSPLARRRKASQETRTFRRLSSSASATDHSDTPGSPLYACQGTDAVNTASQAISTADHPSARSSSSSIPIQAAPMPTTTTTASGNITTAAASKQLKPHPYEYKLKQAAEREKERERRRRVPCVRDALLLVDQAKTASADNKAADAQETTHDSRAREVKASVEGSTDAAVDTVVINVARQDETSRPASSQLASGVSASSACLSDAKHQSDSATCTPLSSHAPRVRRVQHVRGRGLNDLSRVVQTTLV